MPQPPSPALGRRPAAALLADEQGAATIEYALVAALLAILAIGALTALSASTGGLYATFTAIDMAITGALGG
jgi:Flp pilus assembly pilin Flp